MTIFSPKRASYFMKPVFEINIIEFCDNSAPFSGENVSRSTYEPKTHYHIYSVLEYVSVERIEAFPEPSM